MKNVKQICYGHYEQVDGIGRYIRRSVRNNMRSRALTAPKLAKKFGIEVVILKKIFKVRFGMHIQAYVRAERFIFLQEVLLQPKPVKVIALELGYARSTNFSRDFMLLSGIWPRDWRKKQFFLKSNHINTANLF